MYIYNTSIILYNYYVYIISGWWFFVTPLKNDGVKVSWEYYSQNMEK
jgi:hypothetical protein